MARAATAKKPVAKATTAPKKTTTKTNEKAPAKKAPAAKKPVALLSTTILIDYVTKTYEMPATHSKALVHDILDTIAKNLIKGGKVQLRGLGVFEVKKRAARTGRNPNTGEAVKIKPTKRVAFKTARDLKEKL